MRGNHSEVRRFERKRSGKARRLSTRRCLAVVLLSAAQSESSLTSSLLTQTAILSDTTPATLLLSLLSSLLLGVGYGFIITPSSSRTKSPVPFLIHKTLRVAPALSTLDIHPRISSSGFSSEACLRQNYGWRRLNTVTQALGTPRLVDCLHSLTNCLGHF